MVRARLASRVLPMSTPQPYAGAETTPEPEQPEPGPDALALLLAEDENRRLRATVQQLETALQTLEGAMRCAGKVLLPYVRAASRGQR